MFGMSAIVGSSKIDGWVALAETVWDVDIATGRKENGLAVERGLADSELAGAVRSAGR